mmetsp:Transcript_52385/g.125133  ORF Transcript_52385/g.125133 Transcript_52385/m.125133 type:complete len:313 (+) Transcript_52385:75-1013(+)
MYAVGRPIGPPVAASPAPPDVPESASAVPVQGMPITGRVTGVPFAVGTAVGPREFQAPVQVGMAPGQSQAPVQAQPVSTPAQATSEVEIPKGLSAGDRFEAETPDGQTVSIVVPPGMEGGSMLRYSYAPVVQAAAVAQVVGQPMSAGAMFGHPWNPELELAELGAFGPYGFEHNRLEDGGHMDQLDFQASQQAWVMYMMGCGICCCAPQCLPVVSIVWFSVAAVHMCRPAEQRAQLPRERAVAIFALLTFLVPMAMIAMTVLRTANAEAAAEAACQPPKEWHMHHCLDPSDLGMGSGGSGAGMGDDLPGGGH